MPDPNFIIFTLVIFFLSNFFYEISQMFYHSLLPNFSKKKNIGSVSGFAFSLGYIAILPVLFFILQFFILPETTLFNLDKSTGEHVRLLLISLYAGFYFFYYQF